MNSVTNHRVNQRLSQLSSNYTITRFTQLLLIDKLIKWLRFSIHQLNCLMCPFFSCHVHVCYDLHDLHMTKHLPFSYKRNILMTAILRVPERFLNMGSESELIKVVIGSKNIFQYPFLFIAIFSFENAMKTHPISSFIGYTT